MSTSKRNNNVKAKSNTKAGTGYPSPSELATPTDLKKEEVKKIVEAVNPLIADTFALYTKTKNFTGIFQDHILGTIIYFLMTRQMQFLKR
jgi:hypothetical protein